MKREREREHFCPRLMPQHKKEDITQHGTRLPGRCYRFFLLVADSSLERESREFGSGCVRRESRVGARHVVCDARSEDACGFQNCRARTVQIQKSNK